MFKQELKKLLRGAIQFGFKTFYTGLNEGYELIATEILNDLKKEYSFIKIIAVLPSHDFDPTLAKITRLNYRRLLKLCDDIIYLTDKNINTVYTDINDFLLQNTSFVLTCISGCGSRAKYFVDMAMDKEKYVKIIRP